MKQMGVKSAAAMICSLVVMTMAQAAELKVTAEGVRSDEGDVEFTLFSGEDGWLNYDHPGTKTIRVSAAQRTDELISATFTELERGPYAIAVYHDEDLSGQLERGFMWRPKEGWAFSNNIKPRFGPPNYKKARIDVSEDQSGTTVKLKYP